MGIRLVAQDDPSANILEGCRKGDPEARRRVFERYKDRVFSVALGFLKGDHAAAEDVTQEVFVKEFRAASTFRRDARLSTWLHRITVNACENWADLSGARVLDREAAEILREMWIDPDGVEQPYRPGVVCAAPMF